MSLPHWPAILVFGLFGVVVGTNMTVSLSAAASPMASKDTWVALFETRFLEELCDESKKIETCFGKTSSTCRAQASQHLKSCLQTIEVPNKVELGHKSAKLGEELGLCVGKKLRTNWVIKTDEECYQ